MPKLCSSCGESKPVRAFSKDSTQDDKLSAQCLLCEAEQESKELALEVRNRRDEKAAVKLEKKLAQQKRVERKAYVRRVARERKQAISDGQRELAIRVLAKKKLIHFIKRFQPNYDAGWVHYDICQRLEKFVRAIERGESPRLMLFMPPRHGKSLIASDYFPSWLLGHHPDFEVIASSYAVSLPLGFSRKVRGRIKDPAYKAIFPRTALDPESTAAEQWNTTSGGGYVAAGVGGGITGKGAHCLIIDDPIKDAQEADSETIRESNWDWYGSTAYTRLSPGGGILIIQTRWHDDDLSGRLISQMKSLREEGVPEDEIDNWEIVSYPAEATTDEYLTRGGEIIDHYRKDTRVLRKKGEALHDARFPIKRLRRIRRSLQPRHWSALYQQNPVPDEGVFFTKTMFRYNQSQPKLSDMKLFMAWDLAVGKNQTNDYSVGVVGGLDYDDQLFIIDVVRARMDTHECADAILNTYSKYNRHSPVTIGIERGQLELSMKPTLKKLQRERRLHPSYDETLVPITDKTIRARPLQGRMQQGMVYFAATAPWLDVVQHEMLRFPGGVHDDIVDALSWLTRMAIAAEPPRPPKERRRASWRDKLKAHTVGGVDKTPMAQ